MMELLKNILILVILLLNLSCAANLYEFSEEQEKEFSHIRIMNSEQNIQNCDFLKPLEVYSWAENFWGKTKGTYTNAVKLLQYQTNQKGGNLAVIDKIEEPDDNSISYGIKARIFKCK